MANREFEARLKISATERTAAAFNRVAGRLNTVGERSSMINRRMEMLGTAATRSAGIITKTLIPALAAVGGAKAINAAAEARERLEYIAIAAGVTGDAIEEADKRIRKLTKDMAMPYESGIEGFDVLIASGKSLEEAMAFLPEVLKMARATNSEVEDIANTDLKVASAFNLSEDQLGAANDLMAAQGAAGQFETKDMAQYMPQIGAAAQVAGYTGMSGFNEVLAIAQVLREDAANAEAVNTQMKAILPKMRATQTISNFKKMDVDLEKELDNAAAAGVTPVQAFIGATELAIGGKVGEGGDLKLLSKLFTEQDMLLGMTSLLTSQDSLNDYRKVGMGDDVDGTVARALERILDLDAAKIDRAQNAGDTAVNKVANMAAEPTGDLADRIVQAIDYSAAQYEHLQSLGMDDGEIRQWRMFNDIFGGLWPSEEGIKAAYAGGYRGDLYGEDIEARIAEIEAEAKAAADAVEKQMPSPDTFGVEAAPDASLQEQAEAMFGSKDSRQANMLYNIEKEMEGPGLLDWFLNLFDKDAVEEGSREMGQAFTDGAEDVRKASDEARGKMSDVGRNVEAGGDDIVRALGNAATAIDTATTKLTGAAGRIQRRQERANANTGKSMKTEDNSPYGAYD